MQQMQIYGVSFDMVGKQPIVLLKTVDGNRFLPIQIGRKRLPSTVFSKTIGCLPTMSKLTP